MKEKPRIKYFLISIYEFIFIKEFRQCVLSKHEPDYGIKLHAMICRIEGHPHGVIWYNVNGFEPDMTCKNCGDDLG